MDPSRRLRHFRSEIPQLVTEHRFPKRVEKLVFSVLSSNALMKLSEVQITTPILYEHYPSPAKNGVLDKRLGLSDKIGRCATCGKDTKMCIGHFGTIALALPVFHPGLINDARTMLSIICPFCSRVKISEADRHKYKSLNHKHSLSIVKEAQEQAKKQVNCPFCHAPSTVCKKSQGFRVLREMHYEESATKILAGVIKHQKEIEKIQDLDQRLRNHVVDPIQALHILKKVPECDYPYLGIPWQSRNVYASQQTPTSIASNDASQLFSRGSSKLLARTANRFIAQHQETGEHATLLRSQHFLTRPQDVILTHIPVPPSCLRPSVQSGSGAGTTEDSLTSHLVRILTVNDKLKEAVTSGAVTTSKVYAKWDQLNMDVSLLYIGKIPGGVQPVKGKIDSGTKEGTGIIDRLKGKAGRFRSNLSGKRVNFSGRTVISPNPYLSMQQVAIPRLIAQNLTFPEIVTSRNIRFLRELILNGKTYPGANEVLLLNDTIRYNPALKRLGIDMKRSRDMEAKAMELVSRCVDTFNLNSLCADLPELQAAIQHLVSESSNAINSEVKTESLPQESTLFSKDVHDPITRDDLDSVVDDTSETNEPKLEDIHANRTDESAGQLQTNTVDPSSEPKTVLKLNSIASLQLTNASSQHLSTFKLNTVSLLQKDRRGRQAIANSLRPNDIVYRHLLPNDTLLFNRQPSLHRMSIMQFNAVIHENRTFSFNPIVCSPFNADFDGDEMNIFYMQGQEARAEAGILMGSHENIISPRHGECMIGLTQDFLTGIYLLSGKGIFMTRQDYCQHVSYGCDGFGDATYGVSLYNYGREFIKSIHSRRGTEEDTVGFVKVPCLAQPCIVYPRQLYSGKQVLSVLMKGNDFDSVSINLEHGDKTYKKSDDKRALSVGDDYVVIQNSEHLAGRLTKAFLASSKNCIFYFLVQNYGPVSAARIMLRFAKVAARFLMNYGFTIGIDDVMPSQQVLHKKELIVQEGYERAQEKIHDYESGKLHAIPGSTVQETLEAALNQILSNVRESCAQVALKELHFTNKPLIMSLCGSKGSPINIAQMIIILGQQSFGGSRAPDDFYTRSAPYFYHYSKEPNSKGFILNSFYTGLLPFEFLAHARAGRDGVIDSACKTADTGYLQRRLVKCLEDLSVSYDFTVRNSKKNVVQFRFGHDGFDPIKLEVGTAQCLDLDTLLRHIILLNRSQDLAEGVPLVLLDRYKAEAELETLLNKDFYGQEACQIERDNVISYFRSNILPKITANTRIAAEIAPALAASFLQTTITRKDIDDFLRQVRRKYIRLNLEPGSPCGAVAAQSVGEPSTQMTLKSFHHAGLASMNITQGVPRLKEIVDGVVKISTPITTVELHIDADEEEDPAIITEKYLEKARMMKNIIECTYLGQISASIIECYSQSSCHIEVNLDMKIIADMGLAGVITVETVVASILHNDKAKKLVGQDHSSGSVSIHSGTRFSVRPITQSRENLLFDIQSLKLLLPMIPVSGIATCSRAVINEYKEITQGGTISSAPLTKYNLLVEGVGLQSILNVSGIDFTRTLSNNIIEVANTLGIEAAVATIANEIKACMDSHGMAVDMRHIRLLADIMCFKGKVLGFTRFGLTKMKADSVIMLASFEKTGEHLFNAALGNKIDETNGVTESIILGKPMSMGTGSFSLLQAPYFDEKTGKTIEYQPKPVTRFLGEVLNRQYDEEVDAIVSAFWYDEKVYLTGAEARAKLLRERKHTNKRSWSQHREKFANSKSKRQ